MLEFVRSLLSFSWAMSLFGVQQLVNLLVLAEATHAFDEVSAAAASELNAPLRTTLKTANTLIGSFTASCGSDFSAKYATSHPQNRRIGAVRSSFRGAAPRMLRHRRANPA